MSWVQEWVCDATHVLGPQHQAWVCAHVQDIRFFPIATTFLAACVAVCVGLVTGVFSGSKRIAEVPLEAHSRGKRARKVMLLGGEQAGKTNVFLRLTMGVAPDTVTSQRVNTGSVPPSDACAHGLDMVDVPGHARLRTQASEYMDEVDALVFCIDASVASRGGSESATASAALSTLKRTDLQDALVDSVDYLHDVLRTLANRRLAAMESKRAPPALFVLFTRMDRSPLFMDHALLQDEKRRWQLLTRCRRGVESTLVSRRASRGLHRTDSAGPAQGRVMMEDIDEVRDASRRSWMERARVALARVPFLQWVDPARGSEDGVPAELHPTRFGHRVRGGQGHKQTNELANDYIMAGSGMALDEPLQRLDPRIIEGGRAKMGLAFIDRTGWDPSQTQRDSLDDLYTWIETL